MHPSGDSIFHLQYDCRFCDKSWRIVQSVFYSLNKVIFNFRIADYMPVNPCGFFGKLQQRISSPFGFSYIYFNVFQIDRGRTIRTGAIFPMGGSRLIWNFCRQFTIGFCVLFYILSDMLVGIFGNNIVVAIC